ncbi:MAG: hypothetical protein FIA91_09410 [Geobacter sp.]|nr:hypothetical protein [Geobacter sp.]
MTIASRYITSLLLTAVYLLITLMPLAPLAMHSKRVAYAISGECSGDCAICGCSAERSATRTCCCWQKKLARQAADSFRKGSAGNQQQASARVAAPSCCTKQQAHCDNDDQPAGEAGAEAAKTATGSQLAVITACPCGSAKHFALHGLENIQHYPFIYAVNISRAISIQFCATLPAQLSSRDSEPPDPPPRLSLLS